MGRRSMLVVALILGLLPTEVRATERQLAEAKVLFERGQVAFEGQRFQEAHDLFKQAYLLSPLPALLFNMASALQALGRPGEAADALRAYLRASPGRAEDSDLPGRIRGLDEAQRLLDAERLKTERPQLMAVVPPPRWTRRKTIITALSATGAVLVLGAIGLGVGLGVRWDYPSSSLHTQRVTP